MSDSKYAGFWLRFVAFLIDSIILNMLTWILIIPLLGAVGIGIGASTDGFDFSNMTEGDAIAIATAVMGAIFAGGLIGMVVNVIYFALMESSKYQATLGKMALGIKVTTTEGARIDLVKSIIRQIGKYVSGVILMIGYIMAAFTDKKQALHDMIASTLVVKK